MDTLGMPEITQKETRGRSGKMIRLTVELPMSDAQTAHILAGKRMKQLGEYVSVDRIFSEAIQNFGKSLSSQD